MKNNIFLMLGLQAILIFLNAIFACAEIAVISMNDSKLAKLASEGDKRAMRLAKLTNQPARFLATIQVAITLSGFLGSAFAAENFSDVLVNLLSKTKLPISIEVLDSVSVILITIILSYFTLILGELVPKQIAMRKAEKLALGMSGFISGIAKIFSPIVSFLTVSTNGVLRLFGIDPNAKQEEVSEEEIRMMVDIGSENGTIDQEERDFIQNVFDFDNLSAKDLITHRTEVTMLDFEDSVEEWAKTISETRYTYYPICNETPDQIIGVLNTKIYFRLEEKTKERIMEEAVTPAYFVPETLRADILFKKMKKDHTYFAVVLDEFGGLSGIITIKNLIEELVGDLADDVVEEEDDFVIEKLNEKTFKVDGNIPLDDLSELTGLSFDVDEHETLNGMIYNLVGSIPDIDDEVEVEGLWVKVIDIKNNQINTAIVKTI